MRIHVAGIDIVRDARHLPGAGDNLRSRPGSLRHGEPRARDGAVFPNLFGTHPRSVDDYPSHLLRALQRWRPPTSPIHRGGGLDPGSVQLRVLRALVAGPADGRRTRRGSGPVLRDNVVCVRTTDGERQVDVIYRRIDDDYLDPMQFRPDSVLGWPVW